MTDTFFCGRGPGADSPFHAPFNGEATWSVRPNGDRTCSYCGSLHPDDFLDIIRRYVNGEPGYSFSLTDKNYKVYAQRAGVGNAMDGGIKFYGHHAVPEDHPHRKEHEVVFANAVTRHRAEMRERFGTS